MRNLAFIVVLILFFSLGTYLVSNSKGSTFSSIITSSSSVIIEQKAIKQIESDLEKVKNDKSEGLTAITGYVVSNKESEVTGKFVLETPQNNIKGKPFYKTLILPKNGKEIQISENRIYLKLEDYTKLYARHPKLYANRWIYVGNINNLDSGLEAFGGRIEETNILIISKETTGLRVAVFGIKL
ncbi:hypothetical protein HY498_03950 [Candidatus Woesearchaeota archaeon]|nr:hypothetical protein [Candidatus Woesearchaeota archaeon]